MSVVYQARQLAVDRKIALKILRPPADAEDPVATFVARFRQEAETLGRLTHPNIVVLHDSGETEDGRFYLAMEFVDGPRLSDVVREGPLPADRAIRLMLQVCAALRYAHKRGVVHRDLKPSNLMIAKGDGDEDVVKVLDFGLVKLMEQDQALTRENLILGSPHCMSPEQINAGDIDHRTDIYAIGILLFRCLTGHYPFHGAQASATMVEHLHKPVPRLTDKAPQVVVPDGLEAVVLRCLAKEPDDRYASTAELMEDLTVILGGPSGYATTSQTHSTLGRTLAPAEDPEESRNNMAMLVAALGTALLLGVVVVVVVLWVVLSGSPEVAAPVAPPAEAPAAAMPPPSEAPAEPPAAADPPAPEAPAEAPAEATPAPAPSAAKAKAKPPVSPPPEPPAEEPDAEEPEGYMGVPDDLF